VLARELFHRRRRAVAGHATGESGAFVGVAQAKHEVARRWRRVEASQCEAVLARELLHLDELVAALEVREGVAVAVGVRDGEACDELGELGRRGEYVVAALCLWRASAPRSYRLGGEEGVGDEQNRGGETQKL